jgi:molybdate transport repressor ModE-like protein
VQSSFAFCGKATVDSSDLEWLRAVAERGSLSAAAKARGVSVSTASRRLDALEAVLGIRLLERSARGVRLTGDGRRIAALAQPALDAVAAIGRAATALKQDGERKTVRVSATEFVVSEVLAPNIAALQATAPVVTLELIGEAAVVSLAERDADIAVRMARPQGNSLFARALPSIELRAFAAPEIIERLKLDAAYTLPVLTYDDSYGRLPEHEWIDHIGQTTEIVLRTSSTRALIQAAVAGVGAALLPTSFARRAGLIELADMTKPFERTPWITVHQDLRRLPHIRAIMNWIAASFRSSFN